MTSQGTIIRDGRCLEPTETTVAFAACLPGSPRQHWWLVDGRLTPRTAHRKCLSDSRRHDNHFATVDDCADADRLPSVATQRWNFVRF